MLVMMRCITCAVGACPDAAAACNKRVSPKLFPGSVHGLDDAVRKDHQPAARIQRRDSFAPAQIRQWRPQRLLPISRQVQPSQLTCPNASGVVAVGPHEYRRHMTHKHPTRMTELRW
jgi:hypothetical protein